MKLLNKLKELLNLSAKNKEESYVYLTINKYHWADSTRLPVHFRCLKEHTARPYFYNYEATDSPDAEYIKVKEGKDFDFRTNFYNNDYILDTVTKTIYLFTFKGLIKTDIEFVSYVNEVKRTDPYPIIQKE